MEQINDWRKILQNGLDYWIDKWDGDYTLQSISMSYEAKQMVYGLMSNVHENQGDFINALKFRKSILENEKCNAEVKQRKITLRCRLYLIQWVLNSFINGIDKKKQINICKYILN